MIKEKIIDIIIILINILLGLISLIVDIIYYIAGDWFADVFDKIIQIVDKFFNVSYSGTDADKVVCEYE